MSSEDTIHLHPCEVCGELVDMRSIDDIIQHASHPELQEEMREPPIRKQTRNGH